MAHFIFEQFARSPEPALSADHPSEAPAGDVPKGWKHLPDAPAISQKVHSEAKGIHSDADFFPNPSEYLQTSDGQKQKGK